jgi:8-oxo-dGTP pyrophosphatase MutT (NUDIX family)
VSAKICKLVLYYERSEMNFPKNAACIVILDSNRNVLTVTRRNSDVLSLPGGKCDDEYFIDAVIRETMEETGFVIDKQDVIPVYSEVVLGDDGQDFYCVTFLFTWFQAVSNENSWEHEKGIKASFKPIQELLDNGAFREYNLKAFENVNKICSKK